MVLETERGIEMTVVCDCCGELTYPENADDEMDRETTHTCNECEESK